jgi:DNA mismatch endonuclease (patch repair protein)
MPKSRLDFWHLKLEGNARRDRWQEHELADMGCRLIVIWECQVGDASRIRGV